MYLALVVLVGFFDLVEWTHLYLQMGGCPAGRPPPPLNLR